MGSIVGGIIGGVGSYIGSQKTAKMQKAAAGQALTGYNYLNSNPLVGDLQTSARGAIAGQNGANDAIQNLLTGSDQSNPAFQNYLNSTGYQFQMKQGTDAITGSAASKGILNSGSTAKALTGYGQGLAKTSFNNYLGQLSGLSALRSSQVGQGLSAAEAVGAAGTAGGAGAARALSDAGESAGTGISNAFNMFGGVASGSKNPFSFLGGGGGAGLANGIPAEYAGLL